MRTNALKNIITLFLLATFLLLRMVNVHVFSHFFDDEHEVHCELCDIITVSNELTPFDNHATVTITRNSVTEFPVYKTNFCYETAQYSITLPKTVYNKPPPAF